MKDEIWDSVIETKISHSKSRGSKKRGWVVLRKSWLTSSINYRMNLEEMAVFSKLIVMADEFGPVPGLISDNDFRLMPHEYIAHQACCPLEVLEETLKKGVRDDSIYENPHGIFLTHFDEYQFTEYDRQKPYRNVKKEGKQIHKVCPKCQWKGLTNEEHCPECETELTKDYKAGKYGHMVKG